METPKLMIVLGERDWTLKALHLACAVARTNGWPLILVKMVLAPHPMALGTPAGRVNFTAEEELQLQDFSATAEDYNVPFELVINQYVNYYHALTDLAEQLAVQIVLAEPPTSFIPFYAKIQLWFLRHHLKAAGCTLYTLQEAEPQPTWSPALTVHHP